MNAIRQASYALRVVRRRDGYAAIVYRRRVNARHEERFDRIAAISPLGFTAGAGLLKSAVRAMAGNGARLTTGAYHPLDPDWGARAACYAVVASGLRNPSRLHAAAENLRRADGVEAAWWFGLLEGSHRRRAVRALRILVEAVK
jgi:hypothetical protein